LRGKIFAIAIYGRRQGMTCAFTGHRNIDYDHRAGLSGLLQRAIGYAYERGCRRFITGGALGFDTEAAREVIRFRMSHPDVSLIIFIPCLDQDAAWTVRQQDFYDYMLSAADEVKYISEKYNKNCSVNHYITLNEDGFLTIFFE
jgi:uncharacterized phage-like protein YoqJ